MANVLHVIPPTYLVTMFGVPECVALPARIGETCTHARFGTAAEIAADIGVVLECGALPRAKNSMA